jgi:hypothetical protein
MATVDKLLDDILNVVERGKQCVVNLDTRGQNPCDPDDENEYYSVATIIGADEVDTAFDDINEIVKKLKKRSNE